MERVAVIGSGTMGRGIAHVAALAGFKVMLNDVEEAQLARAMEAIRANLEKGVERDKLTATDADGALGRLNTSPSLPEAVKDAHLVIEAVPEDMGLKREVFGKADARAPPDAILATNTSSLSITAIAEATDRPERVVGLHFFNPPHIMPLLEVVRGDETSDATVDAALDFARQAGKTPIVVQDTPGFATSRLGVCLGLEAIRMLEEGVASAEDIDTAMELGYKHPMGPLKLTDLIGLDVRLGIAEHLHGELGDVFEPPQLLRDMVAEGKLGKKTGEGFYKY